jgi:hypothetical protein
VGVALGEPKRHPSHRRQSRITCSAGPYTRHTAAVVGCLRQQLASDVVPYPHGSSVGETHYVLRPTSGPGRWSILAIAVFAVLLAIFALTVASGQRGGESFFGNLWLTVPFLGAYLAAVAAFILGATAMAGYGERSLTVVAATILGLLVTAFGVLEVLLPH